MSKSTENQDINEAFDNLLLGEEIAERSGYEEGFKLGQAQPHEGYHLGYHRASLLAAQLGFYSGVLEYYLKTESLSEKATKLAEKLRKDIESFPIINDDSVDILKTLDDIKFGYTKFCSLAKINPLYPEADQLDF
ncbi:uncharacterized protein LOC107266257 [Cephus cinctus]|uniref:Uncharacterized protein LOC107266257 n=1 Tax=Cephus cinctus TaxID=211228 RepID=A0AAJ7BQS4_CEPCN|nr:uncharacterized protein LOC107266257 [Cephus cinctus]